MIEGNGKIKYAFLDRDGTLIHEPQDTFQIDSLEKLKILDGVIAGLRKLSAWHYELVMISNQDGLGTTSFPQKDFELPHNKMLEIFRENGIKFEKILICPHLPQDNCNCRKPKLGLVKELLENDEIDKIRSFVCGDRKSDKQFAENLGVRFIPAQTNGSFTQAIQKF